MSEFITFLVKNWHLTVPFLGVLLLIIYTEFKEGKSAANLVSPDELTKMINRDHAIVFDIRDDESYKAGHIVDSQKLLVDNLEKSLKKFVKHKTKPCVVVDSDGKAFAQALKSCKELGFERVFGLKGGIAAWKDAGMPLVSE